MFNYEDMHLEDTIDVSEITDRVDELRAERADLEDAIEEADDATDARQALTAWDDDNAEELAALESLLDELRGYGGDHQWEGNWYPATLISECAFTNEMRRLVEDCGYIKPDLPSWIVIDWEATARNMECDYTSVEINDVTFYYR